MFCIFIFLLTAFLVFERQNEFLILMGCGLLGILKKRFMDSPTNKLRVSLLPLFLVFFLSSFSVFGTGYMILPVLHKVLVEQYEWLSGEAFLRAVTYGNMTPGPIVISSTYMGYQIAGNAGAWVSTLGMFLPPFCIVLALGPYLKKIFTHRYAQGFVDGVIPAVSASVLVSLLPLAREMGWGTFQALGLIVGIVLSYRKFSPVKILGLGFVLCFAELIFKK